MSDDTIRALLREWLTLPELRVAYETHAMHDLRRRTREALATPENTDGQRPTAAD